MKAGCLASRGSSGSCSLFYSLSLSISLSLPHSFPLVACTLALSLSLPSLCTCLFFFFKLSCLMLCLPLSLPFWWMTLPIWTKPCMAVTLLGDVHQWLKIDQNTEWEISQDVLPLESPPALLLIHGTVLADIQWQVQHRAWWTSTTTKVNLSCKHKFKSLFYAHYQSIFQISSDPSWEAAYTLDWSSASCRIQHKIYCKLFNHSPC